MDRLIQAINAVQNPSVVGLDPTLEVVPKQIIDSFEEEVRSQVEEHDVTATMLAVAYFEFNRTIIDVISDIVPAVKPQIAMYEALGSAGIDAYIMTCEYAQSKGLYVLGDIKRGDIGSTAQAYAAHLKPLQYENMRDQWHEDAITVNPYLGFDGIEPFIEACVDFDKDMFVLVRTSNPSSAHIQELQINDSMRVYEQIGELVSQWGSSTVGTYGYSRVGAVVGATHAYQGARLRENMPHTFFLIPGYGAQGGDANSVAGMFDDNGQGAIVNSSRGIIGAWKQSSAYDVRMNADDVLELVATSARQAALDMRDALRLAVY